MIWNDENDNIGLRMILDLLSPQDLEILAGKKRIEMSRQEILKQYPIKQLPPPDNRYWIKIDGKLYFRREKGKLEELIINLKEKQNKTIVNLFGKFIEQRKLQVAATTWAIDLKMFKMYIEESKLGNKELKKITMSDGYEFFDYVKSIKPELKEKYWHNLKSILDMFFKFCIQNGYLEKNPIENMVIHQDRFAPKKETAEEDAVFSDDEREKICVLAEKDAYESQNAIPLAIPFLFNTGLRDGELIGLKWCDVSLGDNAYVFVRRIQVGSVDENGMIRGRETADRCKSRKSKRKVPLNSKCVELLEKIKLINQTNGFTTEEDDYIFLRIYKGEISECTERCFSGRLKKYCEIIGIKSKSPHDIRRTALTNLWLNGVPIKIIQLIAGHNSQKQTEEYLKIQEKDILNKNYTEILSNSTTKNFAKTEKTMQKSIKNGSKIVYVEGFGVHSNVLAFSKS